MNGKHTDFDAIRVQSPMEDAGELKDQDRAAWHAAFNTACVCDGVSTSSRSAEGAEHVCNWSPVLFKGKDHSRVEIGRRLGVIADLLAVQRTAFQETHVVAPAGIPAGMAEMLQDIARQQKTQSFQTTMVAANFVRADRSIDATIVRCGDSSFVAFAPDGTLLSSSPHLAPKRQNGNVGPGRHEGRIRFGPDAVILVKVLGSGVGRHRLLRMAGVNPETAPRWIVCAPVDQCTPGQITPCDAEAAWLTRGDVLLVPRFLIGEHDREPSPAYHRVRYSRNIRVLRFHRGKTASPQFDNAGAATHVLPDHVYSDQWIHIQERFPPDTHFILASDGLTGCFDNPADLWAWLSVRFSQLVDEQTQSAVMKQLHEQRIAKRGDDDIAFVCVRPAVFRTASKSLSQVGKERVK